MGSETGTPEDDSNTIITFLICISVAVLVIGGLLIVVIKFVVPAIKNRKVKKQAAAARRAKEQHDRKKKRKTGKTKSRSTSRSKSMINSPGKSSRQVAMAPPSNTDASKTSDAPDGAESDINSKPKIVSVSQHEDIVVVLSNTGGIWRSRDAPPNNVSFSIESE